MITWVGRTAYLASESLWKDGPGSVSWQTSLLHYCVWNLLATTRVTQISIPAPDYCNCSFECFFYLCMFYSNIISPGVYILIWKPMLENDSSPFHKTWYLLFTNPCGPYFSSFCINITLLNFYWAHLLVYVPVWFPIGVFLLALWVWSLEWMGGREGASELFLHPSSTISLSFLCFFLYNGPSLAPLLFFHNVFTFHWQ